MFHENFSSSSRCFRITAFANKKILSTLLFGFLFALPGGLSLSTSGFIDRRQNIKGVTMNALLYKYLEPDWSLFSRQATLDKMLHCCTLFDIKVIEENHSESITKKTAVIWPSRLASSTDPH